MHRIPRAAALAAIAVVALIACTTGTRAPEEENNLLIDLIRERSGVPTEVLDHADRHRLQILYTQIDRDAENRPTFRSHGLRVNTDRYFYPASTVKFPAALLALEKLNRLNIAGVDKHTPLRIDSAAAGQSAVTLDPTAPDSLPTIAHYIRKIFLVSDNDAFNRLYEFLGQQYLMETLAGKGYGHTWIIRRLESATGPEANRITNPFEFYRGDEVLYRQEMVRNPEEYVTEMAEVRQGKAHYSGGELIDEPIDFRHSNYYSVPDMQAMLQALFFPDAVPAERRFDLTEDDYRFLYGYMSMLPRESRYPQYPDSSHWDSYVKFVLFGDSKAPMPDNIRIFNKVGQAYGYLIDNAFVVDFENGVEFFLTAVLQVNENETYNDNVYEYEETGIPFLAELGRAIYDYELKRERPHRPDLSRFRVNYQEIQP